MVYQELHQKQVLTRSEIIEPKKRQCTMFGADVLKIAGGTVFAQLLTVIATPVLARICGPDAFGMLALFTSITTTIAAVSCLRYEMSIMLPRSDKDAANLLGVSFASAATISLLTLPLLYWGRRSGGTTVQ